MSDNIMMAIYLVYIYIYIYIYILLYENGNLYSLNTCKQNNYIRI